MHRRENPAPNPGRAESGRTIDLPGHHEIPHREPARPAPGRAKAAWIMFFVLVGSVLFLSGAVVALLVTRSDTFRPQPTVAAPPLVPLPTTVTPGGPPAPTSGGTAGAVPGTEADETPTAEPAPPAGDAEVLNEGDVQLNRGYCIDLDEDARNWGVSDRCSADIDIGVEAERLDTWTRSDVALMPDSAVPSRATCEAATAYLRGIGKQTLERRPKLCVHTTEGQLSFIEVTNVHGRDDLERVDMHVITWKGSYP